MAARETLLAKIEQVANDIDNFPAGAQAHVLKDLALAFRYVTGGPQPGSAVVEKS